MAPTDGDSCPMPAEWSTAWPVLEGYKVNPAACEGIFKAVELVGWDLAAPHASQLASYEVAFGVFGAKGSGGPEYQVAEAMTDVWNRVFARNMAQTEAMIQVLVGGGRGALAAIAEGDCMMAYNATLPMTDAPEVRVLDGM